MSNHAIGVQFSAPIEIAEKVFFNLTCTNCIVRKAEYFDRNIKYLLTTAPFHCCVGVDSLHV